MSNRVLAKKMRSIILINLSILWSTWRPTLSFVNEYPKSLNKKIPPKRRALLGFYKKGIKPTSYFSSPRSSTSTMLRWFFAQRVELISSTGGSVQIACHQVFCPVHHVQPSHPSIHQHPSIPHSSAFCSSPTCATLQQNHPCPCRAVLQGNSEGNNRLDPLWRVIANCSAIREALKLP